jgi:hypothetical protein
MAQEHPPPPVGHGLLIIGTSRSHSDALQLVGLLWTSDQPVAETSTWQLTAITTDRNPCPPGGFEPTIPASERPQADASNPAATEKCTFVTSVHNKGLPEDDVETPEQCFKTQIKLIYIVQLSDKQLHGIYKQMHCTYIKTVLVSLIVAVRVWLNGCGAVARPVPRSHIKSRSDQHNSRQASRGSAGHFLASRQLLETSKNLL